MPAFCQQRCRGTPDSHVHHPQATSKRAGSRQGQSGIPLSCQSAFHTLQHVQVDRFKDLLQKGTDLTPIEVLWVERPQGNYYFAFGELLKMTSTEP